MTTQILTQEELKSVLDYDTETGVFTWKVTRGSVKAGTTTGCLHISGYLLIRINKMLYKAHRLAFLYMTGRFPDQIDHINHIRHDNRWKNIREVDNQENHRNKAMQSNNTSGHTGVHWDKYKNKWVAQIKYEKVKYLGAFEDIEDALKARKEAEIKYGFHENHGV